MLEAIVIKNYKSIQKLDLKLGRINIFIGENGCGKSNILEAIAFAAAAESNKLDNEFLTNRGIRVTRPNLMRSNFNGQDRIDEINVSLLFTGLPEYEDYKLYKKNKSYSKWTYHSTSTILRMDVILTLKINEFLKSIDKKDFVNYIDKKILKPQNRALDKFLFKDVKNLDIEKGSFKNFMIFSPENTALREFYKEGQIEPLGVNGEGLFKLLKVINQEQTEDFKFINKSLKLLSWYDSLIIPNEMSESNDRIKIKDKYLISEFDQRSANEGFLFILFYIALIVSKDTPKFFAIDNIDASLNPKLCTKIIKVLASLAKKYNKQMLLTTHNPAILDGIDLGDSEQKLYVISRNKKGHTRAKEITVDNKPVSSDAEPLKLSEAMLRGYLGGLPKNF